MMTKCESCCHPGECCRGFVLNLPAQDSINDVEPFAAEQLSRFDLSFFRVTHVIRAVASPGYVGAFSCNRLGSDGRCSSYEDRPDLCKSYEPCSDALCAEFMGPSRPVEIVKEIQRCAT